MERLKFYNRLLFFMTSQRYTLGFSYAAHMRFPGTMTTSAKPLRQYYTNRNSTNNLQHLSIDVPHLFKLISSQT